MPTAMTKVFQVLLVEDNPGDARLIETYLQIGSQEHIELRHVTRLDDAMAELEQESPDVVLLDLGLPDSQGLDTLDRMLAVSRQSGVVVLTGLDDEEMAIEAIHRGAQDYLPKGGFTEALLVRTIRYAAERKQAEDAVRRSEERYRVLFEKASEAVVVVMHGVIQAANPMAEKLLGMPHAALIGEDVLTFLHPEDREMFLGQDDVRPYLENLQESLEFRIQRKGSDDTRWVQMSSKRLDWEGQTASLHLLSDITRRKADELLKTEMLNRQTAINKLTFSLGATGDSHEVCRVLHRHIFEMIDAWSIHVATVEDEGRSIYPRFAIVDDKELDLSAYEAIPIEQAGCDLLKQVVRGGEPMLVSEDVTRDRFKDCVRCPLAEGCGRMAANAVDFEHMLPWSAILVPMRTEGDVFGLLQVQSRRPDAFTQADVDLVAGLGNVAAIALRNNQLIRESVRQARRLREAFEGIVSTVSATTEARDPYTAGHQERVARLASAIAETLGLSDDMIEGIRVAATVHDIGKIGIPAEILAKPGKLSDTEFLIIQSHPENAYQILKSIEFPWPIAELVYQHHERLDGSGYPQGLRDGDISLGARIIAVADVVEAMASHRPYRASLGLDCALEEIESLKGEKLDPQVVEACVALFRERGFRLDDASS